MGAAKLLYGWNPAAAEWIPMLVDSTGKLKVSLAGYTFVFSPQTQPHVEITSAATTPMTCLINGAPTATSVVYDTVANEMDWVTPRNGRLVVWNITRGTSRLISAINSVTNTMTTVATADAWANNDSLTLLSQTVAHAFIDVNMLVGSNPVIPAGALGLKLHVLIRENTALGANEDLIMHPTAVWAQGQEQYLKCQVLNRFASLSVDLPLNNGRVSFSVRVATSAYVVIGVIGYWI